MGEYSVSDRPYQPNRISLIAGRDDTEVENGNFPLLPDPRNCNNRLLYDFRITIGTGNNERAMPSKLTYDTQSYNKYIYRDSRLNRQYLTKRQTHLTGIMGWMYIATHITESSFTIIVRVHYHYTCSQIEWITTTH